LLALVEKEGDGHKAVLVVGTRVPSFKRTTATTIIPTPLFLKLPHDSDSKFTSAQRAQLTGTILPKHAPMIKPDQFDEKLGGGWPENE